MRVARWEGWTLAAVLLLALGLRLYKLDAPLWYDEVLTLTQFVRQPWDALVRDFSSLNNHVLYSLEAKAAIAVLGETAVALRLPALLFGIASIAAVWAMARSVAGPFVALFTAMLLALSYHHIWFSQNARGYTELLFLTTIASLTLVRMFRAPRWGLAALYGAVLAAAMYTHLSAGFFFLGHGLVWLAGVALRRAGRAAGAPGLADVRPFAGFVIGGVLTLLLYLPLFGQVATTVGGVAENNAVSAMAEWSNPLRMVREVAGSLAALGPLAPVALGGALLVFATGLFVAARRDPWLTAIYALSIPLTLALLVALGFRIWPRYFFVDIGFVMLCAALGAEAFANGLARLIGRARAAPWLLAAGALVALGASAALLPRNYALPKQDFAGAAALVAAARQPGDTAVAIGLARAPMASYFAPDWPIAADTSALSAIESRSRRVWVVTAFDDRAAPKEAELRAYVLANYALIAKLDGTLGGGTVKVYRRN